MGRIKTTLVKTAGRDIFEKYGNIFTIDFSKNKAILKEHFDMSSRKLTNVVTGYITKLKKQQLRA